MIDLIEDDFIYLSDAEKLARCLDVLRRRRCQIQTPEGLDRDSDNKASTYVRSLIASLCPDLFWSSEMYSYARQMGQVIRHLEVENRELFGLWSVASSEARQIFLQSVYDKQAEVLGIQPKAGMKAKVVCTPYTSETNHLMNGCVHQDYRTSQVFLEVGSYFTDGLPRSMGVEGDIETVLLMGLKLYYRQEAWKIKEQQTDHENLLLCCSLNDKIDAFFKFRKHDDYSLLFQMPIMASAVRFIDTCFDLDPPLFGVGVVSGQAAFDEGRLYTYSVLPQKEGYVRFLKDVYTHQTPYSLGNPLDETDETIKSDLIRSVFLSVTDELLSQDKVVSLVWRPHARLMARMFASLEVPPKAEAFFAEKAGEFAARLWRDPVYQAASCLWPVLPDRARYKVVEHVAGLQDQIYGDRYLKFEGAAVFLFINSVSAAPAAYDHNAEIVSINIHPSKSWNDFTYVMDSVFHEKNHHHFFQAVDAYVAGKLPTSSPYYQMAEGFDDIIIPERDGLVMYVSEDADREAYFQHPMERLARSTSERISAALGPNLLVRARTIIKSKMGGLSC